MLVRLLIFSSKRGNIRQNPTAMTRTLVIFIFMSFTLTSFGKEQARHKPDIWTIFKVSRDTMVVRTMDNTYLTGEVKDLDKSDGAKLFEQGTLTKTIATDRLTTTWPLPHYRSIEEVYVYRLEGTVVTRQLKGYPAAYTRKYLGFLFGELIACACIVGLMLVSRKWKHSVPVPTAFIVLMAAAVFATESDKAQAFSRPILLTFIIGLGVIAVIQIVSEKKPRDSFPGNILGWIILTFIGITLLLGMTSEPSNDPAALLSGIGARELYGTFVWMIVAWISGLCLRHRLYKVPAPRRILGPT